MRAKVLIALFILGVVAACNKDKFTTEPKLTFKSINGTRFEEKSLLSITLGATDKDGDIKDTLWIQRRSFNCPAQVSDSGVAFALSPNLVKKNNLDLEFEINYYYEDATKGQYLTGCKDQNDSGYFRFWIKDNADHTSDTVSSPIFVLIAK